MAELKRSISADDGRIITDDALKVNKVFYPPSGSTETLNGFDETKPAVFINSVSGRLSIWNPNTSAWVPYAKLSEAGGGSSAQANWDETDTEDPSYIQNKPTALSAFTNDSGFITGSSSSALTNKTGNISQWTNDSGYVTASSSNTFTNKSGNISQWTNNSGYISGISSGDVTTALGFTPANITGANINQASFRTNLGLGTAAYVADSGLVHTTGAETITGFKTFDGIRANSVAIDNGGDLAATFNPTNLLIYKVSTNESLTFQPWQIRYGQNGAQGFLKSATI